MMAVLTAGKLIFRSHCSRRIWSQGVDSDGLEEEEEVSRCPHPTTALSMPHFANALQITLPSHAVLGGGCAAAAAAHHAMCAARTRRVSILSKHGGILMILGRIGKWGGRAALLYARDFPADSKSVP